MLFKSQIMTAKLDVKIIEHSIKFKGYFTVEEFHLRHRLFEGGWSDVFMREIFERGQAAAVLPYDPVRDQVVMIEQFRAGALKDEYSPWLLELVAGMFKPDEAPEEVVHREADEEAGIEMAELIPISHYWVSPGCCTERIALFCGKVDASTANGIHGVDDENEDIRVHVFDAKEAFEMVRKGRINNANAIIALQWLEINHGKVF